VTYDDLIEHFGGCTKAAKALDLPKQTVNRWREAGIPDAQQFEIQKRTGGELKADARIIAKYRDYLRTAA
jgi:hypothetical protein